MKTIFLTLAGLLSMTTAAVYAQTDTLNRQQPSQNQYRTGQSTTPTGVQNPTTPAKPRTGGPEEIEEQLNNPQPQSNQPLPQTPTGSQGTVSGSTPYDTTNMKRPLVPQGTTGTNSSGTTSGTTGSGSYGTGVNGTGSGTKGTTSSYGTKSNSTGQDSTYRHRRE
ncbi:MAG TPA: hypothetical protein VGD65_11190 [Chryseosolibacter sp.]